MGCDRLSASGRVVRTRLRQSWTVPRRGPLFGDTTLPLPPSASAAPGFACRTACRPAALEVLRVDHNGGLASYPTRTDEVCVNGMLCHNDFYPVRGYEFLDVSVLRVWRCAQRPPGAPDKKVLGSMAWRGDKPSPVMNKDLVSEPLQRLDKVPASSLPPEFAGSKGICEKNAIRIAAPTSSAAWAQVSTGAGASPR